MLCEKCNEREAIVTLTMVTNGVSRTHHFCQECAEKFRLDEQNENSELSRTIFRILSDALKKGEQGKPEEKEAEKDIVCGNCGKTYREFLEDGLFGCPGCIDVFGDSVNGTILSIQGADSHTGERPAKVKIRTARKPAKKPEEKSAEALQELKNRLDTAVLLEDYGKAAKLRDEIALLTKGGASDE